MKKYQFNVYDDSLIAFLDRHLNTSEYLRTTLNDIKNGEFARLTELDTKGKLEESKLKISESKADRTKETESLKLRKLQAETEILERQLSYHSNFHSDPTPAATRAIRAGVSAEQTKEQYYISRIDGDYLGCCRICKDFVSEPNPIREGAVYDVTQHLHKHKEILI